MKCVIVGGFMCAMSDCNNNSEVNRDLSFFRFPSDSERYQLFNNFLYVHINIQLILILYLITSNFIHINTYF